jgi:hypothetical protein
MELQDDSRPIKNEKKVEESDEDIIMHASSYMD